MPVTAHLVRDFGDAEFSQRRQVHITGERDLNDFAYPNPACLSYAPYVQQIGTGLIFEDLHLPVQSRLVSDVRIGGGSRLGPIRLFGTVMRNGLEVIHTIGFGGRVCIMLFVLLRYIIVSCRFARHQICHQTYLFQVHIVHDLFRVVLVGFAEIDFFPVVIEPLAILGGEPIHKVEDALVVLRHVRNFGGVFGIGSQRDLPVFLCRLLYDGGEGLVHPRVKRPVVLIQYRGACSVNGHSARLTHASDHFHLCDNPFEVITFARLLVSERDADSLPDVIDEFFRCLLERIAGREVIHNYSKGVMPVKPLMKP